MQARRSSSPLANRRSFVRGSLLVFALSALGLATGCLRTRGPSVAMSAPAPDFTLRSHDGKDVSLTSLLRDGPAVLVFYRGYW